MSGRSMAGRARIIETSKCGGCGMKRRRWQFADGQPPKWERPEECGCGARLEWVRFTSKAPKARATVQKVCVVCEKSFTDASPTHCRKTCGAESCRLEHQRNIQNAWYARNTVGARRAPVQAEPKRGRGRPKRDFHAFGAEHPVSRRALVIPTAVEAAAERKSTNDLTTADADAAALANARNKSCGGCGRKFFDATPDADQAFCGGQKCKRADDERGLTRPWQSFDMLAGIPVVAVAR